MGRGLCPGRIAAYDSSGLRKAAYAEDKSLWSTTSPDPVAASRRPNRLVHETSPYLQQHAYNPVDWYPWGPEALEAAAKLDRPIFLSIGYSACHWCHVMEHESFENAAIAELMNEHFINIKVDREERPDLDQIYMSAVTATHRPRRLADVGLSHAEARTVLRRHLLAADLADGHARFPRRADAGARGVGASPGRRGTRRPRTDRRHRRGGPLRPPSSNRSTNPC